MYGRGAIMGSDCVLAAPACEVAARATLHRVWRRWRAHGAPVGEGEAFLLERDEEDASDAARLARDCHGRLVDLDDLVEEARRDDDAAVGFLLRQRAW
eukprot:scaffold49044_cov73-Phaeocystis_antarctica.AAC.2